jgi:hypothetical protein
VNVFSIVMAGVALEVHSSLTPEGMGLIPKLAPFTEPVAPPAVRTVVRWQEGDPDGVPHGELLFDPGDIWRIHRSPDGTAFTARVAYPGSENLSARAAFSTTPSWDDVLLTEQRRGSAWQSLLATGVGELVFRTRLLFANGMVFHAAGLDDNGRGVVLVGHSGAGKSTQTGLWLTQPGVVAMNDDRVAVRLEEDGPMAYGTPWGGTAGIARNYRAPLAALVVLEQGSRNEIGRLPEALAAPLLLARSYLPYWDPLLLTRATDCLSALLDRVPVFRLKCRPEAAVIPLLRSVL